MMETDRTGDYRLEEQQDRDPQGIVVLDEAMSQEWRMAADGHVGVQLGKQRQAWGRGLPRNPF